MHFITRRPAASVRCKQQLKTWEGRQRVLQVSCKMYVPSDGFGGISPERKAASQLKALFTFIAAKIILAQLEGSGRGALGAYNSEQYQILTEQLATVPLKDGDAWIEQLLKRDRMLALRVMEVRAAYSTEDFEWDQLQRLAIKDTQEGNVRLMRSSADASFKASLTGAAAASIPEEEKQQAAEEQL